MAQLNICVWSNHTAEEQAEFYAGLLPDTRIRSVQRTPVDTPSQKAGDVIVVDMEIMGTPFTLLNGGPMFPQTEAVSFMVPTADQAETDRLWNALTAEGAESACGWCKDKWGVNWQITPTRLMELIWENPDAESAKRAMTAMMTMGKIDIATIERAAAGEAAHAG